MSTLTDNLFGSSNRRRCVKGRASYVESASNFTMNEEESYENDFDFNMENENDHADSLHIADFDDEPVTIDLSEYLNDNNLLNDAVADVPTPEVGDSTSQFRVTTSVTETPTGFDASAEFTNEDIPFSIMAPSEIATEQDYFKSENDRNVDGFVNGDASPSGNHLDSAKRPIMHSIKTIPSPLKRVNLVKSTCKDSLGMNPVVKCERLNIDKLAEESNIKINLPVQKGLKGKPRVKKSVLKVRANPKTMSPKRFNSPISFTKKLSPKVLASKKAHSILVNTVPSRPNPIIIKTGKWAPQVANSGDQVSSYQTVVTNDNRLLKLVGQASTSQFNSHPTTQKPYIVSSLGCNSTKITQSLSPKNVKIVTPILPKPSPTTLSPPIVMNNFTVIPEYVEDPKSPVKPTPLLTLPTEALTSADALAGKELSYAPHISPIISPIKRVRKQNKSVFLDGNLQKKKSPIKRTRTLQHHTKPLMESIQPTDIIPQPKCFQEPEDPFLKAKNAVVNAMASVFAKVKPKKQIPVKGRGKQNINLPVAPPPVFGNTQVGCCAYNTTLNDILFGGNVIEDFVEETFENSILEEIEDSLDIDQSCNSSLLENDNLLLIGNEKPVNKHKLKVQKLLELSQDSDTLTASECEDEKLAKPPHNKKNKLSVTQSSKGIKRRSLSFSSRQKSQEGIGRKKSRVNARTKSVPNPILYPFSPKSLVVSSNELEDDSLDIKPDLTKLGIFPPPDLKSKTAIHPKRRSKKQTAQSVKSNHNDFDVDKVETPPKISPTKLGKQKQSPVLTAKDNKSSITESPKSRNQGLVKTTKTPSKPADILQEINTITGGNVKTPKGKKKVKKRSSIVEDINESEKQEISLDDNSESESQELSKKIKTPVRGSAKKKTPTLKVVFKRNKRKKSLCGIQSKDLSDDSANDSVDMSKICAENKSLDLPSVEVNMDKSIGELESEVAASILKLADSAMPDFSETTSQEKVAETENENVLGKTISDNSDTGITLQLPSDAICETEEHVVKPQRGRKKKVKSETLTLPENTKSEIVANDKPDEINAESSTTEIGKEADAKSSIKEIIKEVEENSDSASNSVEQENTVKDDSDLKINLCLDGSKKDEGFLSELTESVLDDLSKSNTENSTSNFAPLIEQKEESNISIEEPPTNSLLKKGKRGRKKSTVCDKPSEDSSIILVSPNSKPETPLVSSDIEAQQDLKKSSEDISHHKENSGVNIDMQLDSGIVKSRRGRRKSVLFEKLSEDLSNSEKTSDVVSSVQVDTGTSKVRRGRKKRILSENTQESISKLEENSDVVSSVHVDTGTSKARSGRKKRILSENTQETISKLEENSDGTNEKHGDNCTEKGKRGARKSLFSVQSHKDGSICEEDSVTNSENPSDDSGAKESDQSRNNNILSETSTKDICQSDDNDICDKDTSVIKKSKRGRKRSVLFESSEEILMSGESSQGEGGSTQPCKSRDKLISAVSSAICETPKRRRTSLHKSPELPTPKRRKSSTKLTPTTNTSPGSVKSQTLDKWLVSEKSTFTDKLVEDAPCAMTAVSNESSSVDSQLTKVKESLEESLVDVNSTAGSTTSEGTLILNQVHDTDASISLPGSSSSSTVECLSEADSDRTVCTEAVPSSSAGDNLIPPTPNSKIKRIQQPVPIEPTIVIKEECVDIEEPTSTALIEFECDLISIKQEPAEETPKKQKLSRPSLKVVKLGKIPNKKKVVPLSKTPKKAKENILPLKKTPVDASIEHKISPKSRAVSEPKNRRKIYSSEAVALPFSMGWGRELVHRANEGKSGKKMSDVYYFSPESQKLRSMPDVLLYVSKHPECTLSRENFTFSKELVYHPPLERERNAKFAHTPKIKNETDSPICQTAPKKTPKAESGKKKSAVSAKKEVTSLPALNSEKKKKVVVVTKVVKKSATETTIPVRKTKLAARKLSLNSTPIANISEAKVLEKNKSKNSSVSSSRLSYSVSTTTSIDSNDSGFDSTGSSKKPKPLIVTIKKTVPSPIILPKPNIENKRRKYSTVQPYHHSPCSPRCNVSAFQVPSIQCELCLCLFHEHCVPYLKSKLQYACKACTVARFHADEMKRLGAQSTESATDISETPPPSETEDIDVNLLEPNMTLVTPAGTPIAKHAFIQPRPNPLTIPMPVAMPFGLPSMQYLVKGPYNAPPILMSHLTRPGIAPRYNIVRFQTSCRFTPPKSVSPSPQYTVSTKSPLIQVGSTTTQDTRPVAPLILKKLPDQKVVICSKDMPLGGSSSLMEHLTSPVKPNQTEASSSIAYPNPLPSNICSMRSSKIMEGPDTSKDSTTIVSSTTTKDTVILIPKEEKTDLVFTEKEEKMFHITRKMASSGCLNNIFKKLSLCDLLKASQVCTHWRTTASQNFFIDKAVFSGLSITDWERCFLFLQKYQIKIIDFCGLVHLNMEEPWKGFEKYVSFISDTEELVFDQVPPFLLHVVAKHIPKLKKLECPFVTTVYTEPELLNSQCVMELSLFEPLKYLTRLKIGSCGGINLLEGPHYTLPHLKNLRHLALTGINFHSVENVQFLELQQQLVSLEIGNVCSLEPNIYGILGKLVRLKSIRLENGGKFDYMLSEALLKMHRLEVLEILNFKIQSSLKETFESLNHLIHVNMWPDTSTEAPVINGNVYRSLSCLKNCNYVCWGVISEIESTPEYLEIQSPDGEGPETVNWKFKQLFENLHSLLPDCSVVVKFVPRQLWKEFCSIRS